MTRKKRENPFWSGDVLVTVPHSTDLTTNNDIDRDEVAHFRGAGERTALSLEALFALMRYAYMADVMRENLRNTLDTQSQEWKNLDWAWMTLIGYLETESYQNPLVSKLLSVLISPDAYETRPEMLERVFIEMREKRAEREKAMTPEQQKEQERINRIFADNA